VITHRKQQILSVIRYHYTVKLYRAHSLPLQA